MADDEDAWDTSSSSSGSSSDSDSNGAQPPPPPLASVTPAPTAEAATAPPVAHVSTGPSPTPETAAVNTRPTTTVPANSSSVLRKSVLHFEMNLLEFQIPSLPSNLKTHTFHKLGSEGSQEQILQERQAIMMKLKQSLGKTIVRGGLRYSVKKVEFQLALSVSQFEKISG